MGDEIRIIYSQGCDLFKNKTEPLAQDMDRLSEAVTVAQNSDVIILCLAWMRLWKVKKEIQEIAMRLVIRKIFNFRCASVD